MEHWRGSHPGRERIFWSLRNRYSGFLNSSHREGLVVVVEVVKVEVKAVNVVVEEDREGVVEGEGWEGFGKAKMRMMAMRRIDIIRRRERREQIFWPLSSSDQQWSRESLSLVMFSHQTDPRRNIRRETRNSISFRLQDP